MDSVSAIIGLDLSFSAGIAVLESRTGRLIWADTVIQEPISDQHEPTAWLKRAWKLAQCIKKKIQQYQVVKIVIEQTNLSRNRITQKQLEFLHAFLLYQLNQIKLLSVVEYVDTSRWRSALNVRLTKEQKKHNKQLRQQKKRGILKMKHLAVLQANERFNLQLKTKDHNTAEAILVALYGYLKLKGHKNE